MVPQCVLPTDSWATIRLLLTIALVLDMIAVTGCWRLATLRLVNVQTGDCQHTLGTPLWFCAWNVAFWVFISILLVGSAVSFARALVAQQILQKHALDLFWLNMSRNYILLGQINFIDQLFKLTVGLYSRDIHKHAFGWQTAITAELFLLGALSRSPRYHALVRSRSAALNGVRLEGQAADN